MKTFKAFLLESKSRIVRDIESVFKITLAKFSDKYKLKVKDEGDDWFAYEFINEKNYTEQSILMKVTQDGTLELSDVYVPESIRNKGFMKELLSSIRKVHGLNGRCKVDVPVKVDKWKKLIASTGFEWEDSILPPLQTNIKFDVLD